jgi:hypothetical protein
MSSPIKDLGPCDVDFDGASLGKTFGGVKFRYTEETAPVKTDQTGVTEIDGITSGVSACEAEVPLTRASLANLLKVLGNAVYEAGVLTVGTTIGKSLKDNAKVLILKPIIDNEVSSDATTWLTAALASPRSDWEVDYSPEGQRVYKVIFKIFPNDNNELFKIGA